MKILDRFGAKLCSLQAKIFSESLSLKCSSMIFIRRFFYSKYAFNIDFSVDKVMSFDSDECFYELEKEFGDSDYGINKYSEAELHYLGYITRYICYTREVTSSWLYHTFDIKKILDSYYVWHTQSEEYAVRELLKISHLTEDVFNERLRYKKIIKKRFRISANVS